MTSRHLNSSCPQAEVIKNIQLYCVKISKKIMSLEFPIDAPFWKWCQSAYPSQRLKIISDFHFQEIKSAANNDMGMTFYLVFPGSGEGERKN